MYMRREPYGRSQPPRRSYGGRSAEQRRAERRERLLSAALELFGTQGYAATSIERLCTAAAVSTRNFYEEFASRETLLIALHDDLNTRAISALTDTCAQAADVELAERVERSVRACVAVTTADPRWARINHIEIVGVSADAERHRMAWRERWAKAIHSLSDDAQPAGSPDPLTSVAMLGAADSLIQHWLATGHADSADYIAAELARLILVNLTCP